MSKKDFTQSPGGHDFHPAKKLGQNFLVDDNFLDFIVRTADPQKDEATLEVGPGFGSLTKRLLERGAKVTAVERDRRLAAHLRGTLGGPNFTLVEGDACKLRHGELFPEGTPWRCVSNLPYSISGVFTANIFKCASPPYDMTLMLQREMAERLASPEGRPEYGALSVCAQSSYSIKIVRIIPPDVFRPRPSVESALARFELRKNLPPQPLRVRLSTMVRIVFSHRRKKMINVLKRSFGDEPTDAAFELIGIDRDTRPERVPPCQYLQLAEFYEAHSPGGKETRQVSE